MATNYVTTNLADFTNADPSKVLQAVILQGKGTKDYFDIATGVKYLTKVPYVNSYDVDISTGALGGYNNGSGSTTAIDVTLQDAQLKIQEVYTKETLNKTILALAAKNGSNPEEMILEDVVLKLKGDALHLANEKLIWQDDKTLFASTGGVLQQLTDASTYKSAGFADVSFQTISDASILSYIALANKSLETNLPQFIGKETILAMSPANFSAYSRAVYSLNGAVSTQTVGADGKPITEMYVPGTSIKAVSMIGLTGSNEIVLTTPENIIVVTDMVDEEDTLELWYNKAAYRYELVACYKLGVKVVDATKVVKTI